MDDRLVTQVHVVKAAGSVQREVVLTHGEERGRPRPCLAEGEKLVEHNGDRGGRSDGITGHQGVSVDVGVGHHGFAIGREEEVLVVAQGKVGKRVPAIGRHQAAGVVPVVLGVLSAVRERTEDEVEGPQQPGDERMRSSTGLHKQKV